MADAEIDVRDQIIAFKRRMAPRREALKRAYAGVTDYVIRAADIIGSDVAAGRAVVPEVDYRDIRNSKVARPRRI